MVRFDFENPKKADKTHLFNAIFSRKIEGDRKSILTEARFADRKKKKLIQQNLKSTTVAEAMNN
jgi:hypothetical protein